MDIPSNPDGMWRAQTPDITIAYQRIYPHKVTVDIAWANPEFRAPYNGNEFMSVVRAVQMLREKEIDHLKRVFADGSAMLLPQLANNGIPNYVHPETDHDRAVHISRQWTVTPTEIVIAKDKTTAVIDNEHGPDAIEVFLADQILQSHVRVNIRALLELYDGNLLKAVIGRWTEQQLK